MSNLERVKRLKSVVDSASWIVGADVVKAAVDAALQVPAPAGSPASLARFATTYRTAANGADRARVTVSGVARQGLPEAWVGTTSELASDVITALAEDIDRAVSVLGEAAQEIHLLGQEIAEAQQRHSNARPPLFQARALLADIDPTTAPFASPLTPGQLRVIPALAAAREGVQRLLDAEVLADNACRRFARQLDEFASEAKAGRLTGRGLTSADKIVLGGAAVPGAADGGTILSDVDMSRASAAMAKLDSAELERLDALLANCKSPQERAYLLKALAAGYSVDDVTTFDGMIHAHGEDLTWLRDRLSPASARSGNGEDFVLCADEQWTQAVDRTCVTVSTVLARAMVDPVYALQLTAGGHPGDTRYDDGGAFAERLVGEHFFDEETGVRAGIGYEAVYPKDFAERQAALTRLEATVDEGKPVPVRITAGGPQGHQLMVIGRDGDRLEVYNPWGYTGWIHEDDFLNQHMDGIAPVAGGPRDQLSKIGYVLMPR
jgi:hypothetical protein